MIFVPVFSGLTQCPAWKLGPKKGWIVELIEMEAGGMVFFFCLFSFFFLAAFFQK